MSFIKILAINPGSTSTKIAVYENGQCTFLKTIRHPASELAEFDSLLDQYAYRKKTILKELGTENIGPGEINFIIGRGGLTKPLTSGVYKINEAMINDLRSGNYGVHASNLAPLIAADLASKIPNTQAFISDPVVTDEFCDIARISGHPNFVRKSIFHALNQKAVARQYAQNLHKNYDELNLIVTHMGGGISIGAHEKGKVIDVNNALDGEGPFSPERSGTLPNGQLVDLCFAGHYDKDQVKKMLVGEGGFVGHLDTNDALEVIQKAKTDPYYNIILEALTYQTAKLIGEMATVLKGKVDAIILTGGLAYSDDIVEMITERVGFIGDVVVSPGEDEMKAMATNIHLMLQGKVEVKEYK